MDASRRSFLGGVLSLMAAPALPKIAFAASLPIIYGDGDNDDWAGLQALMDGQPFHVENEAVLAKSGELHRGLFMLSRPLVVGNRFNISNSAFTALPGFNGNCILRIPASSGECRLSNIFIDGTGTAACGLRVNAEILDNRGSARR